MDGEGGGGWTEAVEDLLDRGDVVGAITVLESLVADLQAVERRPLPPSDDLRLASALSDLVDLHDSRGFSLKADELRSHALALRSSSAAAAVDPPTPVSPSLQSGKEEAERQDEEENSRVSSTLNEAEEEQDDWEAMADRGLHDSALFLPQNEAGVSSMASHEDVGPKRRGRGSFLYKKSCLYSEQLDTTGTAFDRSNGSDQDSPGDRSRLAQNEATRVAMSGRCIQHVLVLYDFPPRTRTIDLEKFFEKYKDGGVAIRWVNDTVALAVFQTPSLAKEAHNNINCSFKVRLLDENDSLLAQLTSKDLEPPYPRPKTSTRTAQRLIAQVMGIKPSMEFGSNELRKQEEARKNRILARQALRDDAWGSEEK